MEQLYPGKEDYINHFNAVLPAFLDKRYIKVEDKPIFMFYAPQDFPDIKEFMKIWNEMAHKNGIKGIHFVGLTGGWIEKNKEVLDLGVEAIAPSNLWHAETKAIGRFNKMLAHKLRNIFPGIWLNKYKYKTIIKYLFTDYDRLENAYPSIIPQWDRSARSGRRAVIYTDSTPELFDKHVKEALNVVANKPVEKRIIFLRSWNEWAEGNYVEPDLKFGHGYLDVINKNLK